MPPSTTHSAPDSPYASLRTTALTKVRVFWAQVRPGCHEYADYYSFDSSGRYQVADPRAYGIRGLKKMVDEKFGEKVLRAIIYDRREPDPKKAEVCRKECGAWNR